MRLDACRAPHDEVAGDPLRGGQAQAGHLIDASDTFAELVEALGR